MKNTNVDLQKIGTYDKSKGKFEHEQDKKVKLRHYRSLKKSVSELEKRNDELNAQLQKMEYELRSLKSFMKKNGRYNNESKKPIKFNTSILAKIKNKVLAFAANKITQAGYFDTEEPIIAKAGREPVQVAPTRTNSDGFKKIEGLVEEKSTELGKKDESKKTESDLSSSKPVDVTDDSKKNNPISFGQAPVVKVAGTEEWNKLIDQAYIDVDIPESNMIRQKPMQAQKPIKNSTTDEKKTTKSTTDSFYDKHGFYQNSASYFDSKFGSKVDKPIKKVDKDTIDKQKQMNNEIENAIKKQEENIQKQKAEYENKMAAILKAAQAKEEARKASLMQQKQDLMKQAEDEKQQQNQALADMMAEYGIKPEDLEESQEKTR